MGVGGSGLTFHRKKACFGYVTSRKSSKPSLLLVCFVPKSLLCLRKLHLKTYKWSPISLSHLRQVKYMEACSHVERVLDSRSNLVWGLIPSTDHVKKCWANFSFHGVSVSAYSAMMGAWWMKNCVWVAQAACIFIWSVPCILHKEMRLVRCASNTWKSNGRLNTDIDIRPWTMHLYLLAW